MLSGSRMLRVLVAGLTMLWAAPSQALDGAPFFSQLPPPLGSGSLPLLDDAACESADGGLPPMSVADDFSLAQARTIDHLVLWGLYRSFFPPAVNAIPPAIDNFTVILHGDAGVPGGALNIFNGLAASSRVLDPNAGTYAAAGFDVYRIELQLPSALNLAPGVYHLEIFNDTAASGCFAWIDGLTDPRGGSVAGYHVSGTTPGSTWSSVPEAPNPNLSLQLFEQHISVVEIPTLGRAGLLTLVTAVLAAGISLLVSRR